MAPLLGIRLGRPVIDLDTQRWEYYTEVGYSHDHAQRLVDEQGVEALVAYWEPFELYAVERVLSDHHGSITAFGIDAISCGAPRQRNRLMRKAFWSH